MVRQFFECDWRLIELSDNKPSDNTDNKLSNNNLASKLVENEFFKPITIKEIVIFYDFSNV